MFQILLDYGSFLGFAIFTLGIIFQMKKVLMTRSSKDIAVSEVLLRLLASVIIFAKIVSIKDPYLITGQGLFLIVFLGHIALVIKYRQGTPS